MNGSKVTIIYGEGLQKAGLCLMVESPLVGSVTNGATIYSLYNYIVIQLNVP